MGKVKKGKIKMDQWGCFNVYSSTFFYFQISMLNKWDITFSENAKLFIILNDQTFYFKSIG